MIQKEKGSIALSLVIMFALGITVLALTQLIVSEKITARNLATSHLGLFYDDDLAIEMTTNLVLQKLMSKEWDDSLDGEEMISESDVLEIQNVLNTTILPYEKIKKTASIQGLSTVLLSSFCSEEFETPASGGDPYFVGYTCSRVPVDIEMTLVLDTGKSTKSYTLDFEDLYLTTTYMGDSIVVDKSELVTDIRPF